MATAAAAVAALWFTGQSLRATQNQYGLTQRTWFTDRFTKATEQLGNEKLNVRLGGIYSLEWLARDSPPGQPSNQSMIFEVVSAFVRTYPASHEPGPETCGAKGTTRLDVQAALTVIGRRDTTKDGPDPIDLADSDLRYSELRSARLHGAVLSGADLTCGQLSNVDLSAAQLIDTRLVSANLSSAKLAAANLNSAFLTTANLAHTDLTDAVLIGANLSGAVLADADLTGADLIGADLGGADLTGVKLSNIRYDPTTNWPIGFAPPPSR
ncbi:pentapeptide repeat-containing protein [Nocardia brasiliensis]|uniref:pentapeptide repeat-containing protein n=1 Tax=Nocardia brasiliensis TaxID=37326 RepID=UPI0024572EC7|nr:pentapeptide repeat-containing protein [Nocardia brasiliensis]